MLPLRRLVTHASTKCAVEWTPDGCARRGAKSHHVRVPAPTASVCQDIPRGGRQHGCESACEDWSEWHALTCPNGGRDGPAARGAERSPRASCGKTRWQTSHAVMCGHHWAFLSARGLAKMFSSGLENRGRSDRAVRPLTASVCQDIPVRARQWSDEGACKRWSGMHGRTYRFYGVKDGHMRRRRDPPKACLRPPLAPSLPSGVRGVPRAPRDPETTSVSRLKKLMTIKMRKLINIQKSQKRRE